ncbi:MAG: Gfo/Idh/MocA family oxidoreductase, partial [Planctomycetes bacterium]|nr:Gfo/Idh/MocA family oxidoreductase [Planctomycetota bacterium]
MAKAQRIPIGIVGCGNISGVYLKRCGEFEVLRLAACADLDMGRARAKAAEFPGVRAVTVADLLADPEIRIVVNLTTPQAHASVALAALAAGKSVHNEKPLAIRREDARRMLALARRKRLRVGGAPDTFLGAGLQTCRKVIDDGLIGRPVAATAFMLSHGPEHWHPDPEFVYRKGAGPMFDMGPYYLTALVALLGPVKRITGATARSMARRPILSKPKRGQMMKVEVQTHVAGLMDFAGGAVGTIITSFDVWSHNLPRLEIYGTDGTLSVPDPNTFGGPVRVCLGPSSKWKDVPLSHPYAENWRGIGVADMACALLS